MARILVISPSGEVYDHDNVRWYRYADLQSHIDHYHNIGDAFVFDSSLKLLNFEKLDALAIDRVEPAMIDRLNAEYDYVFLRGSNYVHAQMNWSKAAEVLRRLKLPVIAFGIGAQAPVSGKLELSEDTKTVLKLISDSTASLGVRACPTTSMPSAASDMAKPVMTIGWSSASITRIAFVCTLVLPGCPLHSLTNPW